MSSQVLVVDDEPGFRMVAEEALAAEGFEVLTAATLRRARQELDQHSPDLVVLDRRLPDGDGIEFLKALRTEGPGAPAVLVVTAYGDVENAVEALRAGASDYLTKPVQLTDLVVKLRKILEARGLKDRLALARSGSRAPMVPPSSAAMKEVVERLHSVSISPLTPVFIHGPSGVGKQYAAETLHAMTWNATDQDAPFVEVNCAALPEELVESELFGHEKGAFTDAKATRRGLIEMAAGGTLFLDEITELPLRSQAKLLKFIDSMRLRRVGGQREIEVQLRVVAATNQDTLELVKAGRFREDLYHRLAVFTVTIPPLSQRQADIPDLVRAYVHLFSTRVKKRITGVSPGALAVLQSYGYPGNVRELRNIVERAVILTRSGEITEADVVVPAARPAPAAAGGTGFFTLPLKPDGNIPTMDEVEGAYAARVLEHLGGRRMQAATALGISYPTFLKHLREHGAD